MAQRTDRVEMVRGVPKIVRFSSWERFGHLVHLLSFITLALTGLFIYVPGLAAFTIGDAGEVSRMIHRIAAVIFLANPILYALFDTGNFLNSLGQAFKWTKDDMAWFGKGLGSYWTGKKEGMPPQGKFSTGQKLNSMVQTIALVIFAITGLGMWFAKTSIPSGVFQAFVVIHDIAMLFAVGFFLIHFFMGLVNPFTRAGASSIVDGYMSIEDAKAEHKTWFDKEVKNKGAIH